MKYLVLYRNMMEFVWRYCKRLSVYETDEGPIFAFHRFKHTEYTENIRTSIEYLFTQYLYLSH